MIKEEVISFETAKLSKEKGFNEVISFHYGKDKIIQNTTTSNSKLDFGFSTPTQSLLQRWLREVHDINVLIDFETIDDSETAYTFKIVKHLPEGKGRKKDTWDFYETTYSFNQGGGWYKTYEEALEDALFEGLNLINIEKDDSKG